MVETTNQGKADEDLTKFDVNRFVGQITELAASPMAMKVETWVNFLVEITQFFKEFGSALYLAFSDVSTKAQIIKDNSKFLTEMYGL